MLGAARSIAALSPEGVEVHFIVAACENMVSAEAFRPGDILKAPDGKNDRSPYAYDAYACTYADALHAYAS